MLHSTDPEGDLVNRLHEARVLNRMALPVVPGSSSCREAESKIGRPVAVSCG